MRSNDPDRAVGRRHNLTLRAQSFGRSGRSDSAMPSRSLTPVVAARASPRCSSRSSPRRCRCAGAAPRRRPRPGRRPSSSRWWPSSTTSPGSKVERATKLIEDTNRRIQLAETRVATVRDRIRGRAAALYRRSSAGLAAADHGRRDLHRAGPAPAVPRGAPSCPTRSSPTRSTASSRRLRAEEASQRQARTMLQRDVDNAARLKRRLDALAREAAARNSLGTGDGAGPVATTAAGTRRPDRGAATAHARAPADRRARPPSPTTRPRRRARRRRHRRPATRRRRRRRRRAIAVAYARAQLGKPYVFATAGPEHVRLLGPHDGGVGRGRRPHAALLGLAGDDVPEGRAGTSSSPATSSSSTTTSTTSASTSAAA